jgi:hypothetical protein
MVQLQTARDGVDNGVKILTGEQTDNPMAMPGDADTSPNYMVSPLNEPKKRIQEKLPTYNAAYDKLSDEQKAKQTRKEWTTEAEGYNDKKYGTKNPSNDAENSGQTREQLAEKKKTKDETKSFDGSGSDKKKGVDSEKSTSRPAGDVTTRKGRKEMKKADKKAGLSRKEVKSRKLSRKANAAALKDPESKQALRLKKRADDRNDRLNKDKKKK